MFSGIAEPKVRILSVSANRDDHLALNRMIDHKCWELQTASTCRSAVRRLDRNIAVIFSECSLPDGTWKDIRNRIVQMDKPPQLIVTSRLADAYLWSEVLNLGGFDVLAKPLIEWEVRRTLAAVSRFRTEPARHVRVAGTM
jgi:DNA-binding NtrC family response regulator